MPKKQKSLKSQQRNALLDSAAARLVKRTEKQSLKGTKYVLSLGIVHPICVRWMNKQKEN